MSNCFVQLFLPLLSWMISTSNWRRVLLFISAGSRSSKNVDCSKWLTEFHPKPVLMQWFVLFSISDPKQQNEWQIIKRLKGKCYSHVEIVTNLHILKLWAPHGIFNQLAFKMDYGLSIPKHPGYHVNITEQKLCEAGSCLFLHNCRCEKDLQHVVAACFNIRIDHSIVLYKQN